MSERFAKMMREFSKNEPVTVENIKGVMYAFTSEIGALRIFAKYQSNGSIHNPKVRVGFSENLGSWYCSVEMSI